jgi:hypothetical protein
MVQKYAIVKYANKDKTPESIEEVEFFDTIGEIATLLNTSVANVSHMLVGRNKHKHKKTKLSDFLDNNDIFKIITEKPQFYIDVIASAIINMNIIQ